MNPGLRRPDFSQRNPLERQQRGTVLTWRPAFGTSAGTLLVAVVVGLVSTLLQMEISGRMWALAVDTKVHPKDATRSFL